LTGIDVGTHRRDCAPNHGANRPTGYVGREQRQDVLLALLGEEGNVRWEKSLRFAGYDGFSWGERRHIDGITAGEGPMLAGLAVYPDGNIVAPTQSTFELSFSVIRDGTCGK
jgi:hypothetical protein